MKILSVDKVREGDLYTIKNEPIASIDLMERAANACFYWLTNNIPDDKKINVFCGPGNNGGDGLAIARMLAGKSYATEVFLFDNPEKFSPDCRENFNRLSEWENVKITMLKEGLPLPTLHPSEDIIIDALFGSGLSRLITGFYARIIHHMNDQKSVTISIDVPSGLFCDETMTGIPNQAIVHADHTLTFAPPKLAFFFPEDDLFVGNWHLLDIGISEEFISQTDAVYNYTTHQECARILKKRNKFSHKGTFGHAYLVSGSKGKMGAAVLAAKACLRSGPGLVTVHIPKSGNNILQTAVPEAMLNLDENEEIFTGIKDISAYSSIAIGPGIGQADQSANALKFLIQNTKKMIIFDADAINILGENKTWIPFIPQGSIFTPHPKEFERLVGKSSDNFERNKLQREFSIKHGVYIVLKGANTCISTPDGKCWFNSSGNPGMATGGSGDVLTGILAGLKAQGYSSLETCLLGVYIHGLAGDLAVEAKSQEALIASDIIDYLGNAFLSLYGQS
jgi:ADP-dependent NAD(P)H-hydrate dehydratase / NAD(P)H-hydrate epimerase